MPEINTHERELIKRFETAFNRADVEMRNILHMQDRTNSFSKVIQSMKDKSYMFQEKFDFLKACNNLRNYIVHEHYELDDYMAIPHIAVIEKLEEIASKLKNPLTVGKFKTPVTVFQTDTPLSVILTEAHKRTFSQFPIYYPDGSFYGLLTENGIYNWLAKSIVKYNTLANLEETASDALAVQESLDNNRFVSQNTLLIEATSIFLKNLSIEAILITHSGKKSEKLLGIITQYDVLQAMQEER